MSKKAFDKIAEGLREALSVARGEAKPARLHILPDNAPLHVIGVIRDRNLDKSSAITVLFSGPIGDADLREFHEYVSKWRAPLDTDIGVCDTSGCG